jgi:hypothetical protein
MSGFLYDIVDYVHDDGGHTIAPIFNASGFNNHTGTDTWNKVWTPQTAPLFLIPLLFPLLNLKDITFFTKFNTLGVVSIVYMLFFVLFTTFYGEHFDDSGGSPFGGYHLPDPSVKCEADPSLADGFGIGSSLHQIYDDRGFGGGYDDAYGGGHGGDSSVTGYAWRSNNRSSGSNGGSTSNSTYVTGCGVKWVAPTVFSLTGVLMLSYFMHNGALSIMRNNNPQNNNRDLWTAFILVCLTYSIVAVCFYVSYQGDKSKILQNFLSNFNKSDGNYVYALTAECFLLVQMITVFPLLMFIVRFQAFSTFFSGNPWPSLGHVLLLNMAACSCAVLVAVFYPKIGNILRYTGAVCGSIYVFALPMLVRRTALKRSGQYTWVTDVPTCFFIGFGIINIIMQFVTPKVPGMGGNQSVGGYN